MNLLARVGWLGLILGLHVNTSGQIFIDSFDAGPFSLTLTTDYGELNVSADPSQVLGGGRDVLIDGEYLGGIPRSSAELQSGTGFLDYQRSVQNGYFFLNYGVYRGLQGASINVDLTAGGLDRLALNILNSPGPFTIKITAIDNASNGQTAPGHNERQISFSGSGPGAYEIPYSAFGPVEFDKIAGIRLWIDPNVVPISTPGLYRFESFTAVPEPASYAAVFGVALIVFAACRGRTRPTR